MGYNFIGVIIEESLEDREILKKVKIIKTKVEKVTEKHKTPWIKQWTLHTVEIAENQADSQHAWYADFKNDNIHFILFRDKIFKINRIHKEQYEEATKYGLSLGIPKYQVDFSPQVKEWER